MKKLTRLTALLLAAATASTLSACHNSSAADILKEDYNNIIEEIQNPSPENVEVKDLASEEKKEYYTTLTNASGNLTVKVNASIEIPKTDKLSVFAVKQAPFKQEFVDKVIDTLFGDDVLYDGEAMKAQEKINYWFNSIATTGSETMKKEYQHQIALITGEYKAQAGEQFWKQFVSDGKLSSPVTRATDKPFYEWAASMYPNGEYLNVFNGEKDEHYSTLTVYNSPEDSNRLWYVADAYASGVNSISEEAFEAKYTSIDAVLDDEKYEKVPEFYAGPSSGSSNMLKYRYYTTNTLKYTTKDEAVMKADKLLESLGIEGFECYSATVQNRGSLQVQSQPIYVCTNRYKLTYYRNINGVFLTQSSGAKHNLLLDNENGGMFGKKNWAGESITVYVDDDGISEFIYQSPLEITETISENVAIKPLEEAKAAFEKVVKSSTSKYPDFFFTKTVDLVRLSYSRVSEGDTNYETGLIVPMWDFSGIYSYGWEGRESTLLDEYCSHYAVNAVDGTVINPSNGYY